MHFAILQTWGLGDLVMTTPVISEFRRLHPDAKLTLIVGGPAQAALMAGCGFVDDILQLWTDAPEPDRHRFCLGLRRRKIDAIFIGTRIGERYVWPLKTLSGIPAIIGDTVETEREDLYPFNVGNTVNSAEHRVDRMLNTFAMWSGQRPARPRFVLGSYQESLPEANAILAASGLQPGSFVLVHPGSAGAELQRQKRIPVEVALRVAGEIVASRPDLDVAFIFGPQDLDLLPHFQKLPPRHVVITDCSVPTTVGILSQATGFIGADSGLGHIAAALGIRTLTLIGPTVPTETAAYGPTAAAFMRRATLDCQPCWGGELYGNCPYGIRCMHELPESDIVAEVMTWPGSSGSKRTPPSTAPEAL
jgi:ADP-heptose:LPS heptosyltransferase